MQLQPIGKFEYISLKNPIAIGGNCASRNSLSKQFTNKVFLYVVFLFFFVPLLSAQPSHCDNCPMPHVQIYATQILAPKPSPDDTLGDYLTQQSYAQYGQWLSLSNTGTAVAEITTDDPKYDCVVWMGGPYVAQTATLPDTMIRSALQGLSDNSLPISGPVTGPEYLIWSKVDTSGGQYTFSVYLEDAITRDRVATGTAIFTDSTDALSQASSAVSQIEPVFDNIRAYQKTLRNNDSTITIHAEIEITPRKTLVSGGDTITVSFRMYDCDGAVGQYPLKHRTFAINAVNGHFNHDSLTTDSQGKAYAIFTADFVTAVAQLEAIYYPYPAVYHQSAGSWTAVPVDIDFPTDRHWRIDFVCTADFHDGHYTLSFPCTGCIAGDEIITDREYYESLTGTEYVIGDFSDSTFNIDDAVAFDLHAQCWSRNPWIESNRDFFSTSGALTQGWLTPDVYVDPNSITPFMLKRDSVILTPGFVFPFPGTYAVHSNTVAFRPYSTEVYDTSYIMQIGPAYMLPLENGIYSGTAGNYQITGSYLKDSAIFTEDGSGKSDTYTEHWSAQYNYKISAVNPLTGVKEVKGTVPGSFTLDQNYPNPFNPVTSVRYGLPQRSNVVLVVFNTLGQKILTLVNGIQEAGQHHVTFDGSKLASGLYFYKIEAISGANPPKTFTQVKKMVLLK